MITATRSWVSYSLARELYFKTNIFFSIFSLSLHWNCIWFLFYSVSLQKVLEKIKWSMPTTWRVSVRDRDKIPTSDKNTKNTNIIKNLLNVSCVKYSETCVQCTTMIINDCQLWCKYYKLCLPQMGSHGL